MASTADRDSGAFVHVDSPPSARKQLVADFVQRHGGRRSIQRVLIANNGIAAVKEIRSVRKWAYGAFGNEHAIEFVAMATPEDVAANAEYVRMADEYVAVPGGPNNLNYANVQLIVDIAQRSSVQAVWAGWGHASENPKLPQALDRIGIVFIGPTSSAMHALGDKISSMIVAQSASVACLPWSGSGITVLPDEHGLIETIPAETYAQACVGSVQDGLHAAAAIGFPLMIKASEGGGGKGIRRVEGPEDFAVNFDFVQREVPGSPIFLMKLASEARHLEVQLLADEYGQAISLYGRDCSVQRRHQKIIEEAPVTAVKQPSTWTEMERAAVRLAKLVGYVSAGTVEYLYDVVEGKFSFLELNPRLQVEHPCTEMVSKVNLPAAQLQVAMGIPLHRISDIRRLYGLADLEGSSPIDFDTHPQEAPVGHVIACRITAENPEAGFKPGGGRMKELTFRGSTDVWGYFSIQSSGNVHEFADSQFGHIFAWGNSRNEARRNMVLAIKEMSIRGDFRTTVEYLVRLLETETFVKGLQTTAWLDSLIKNQFGREYPSLMTVITSGASWHACHQFDERTEKAKALLQKGQKPGADLLNRIASVKFIYDQVQYRLRVLHTGPDRLMLEMNESRLPVQALRLADGGLLVSLLGGRTLVLYGKEESQGLRLNINGRTVIIEKENDPSVVRSPSPGKLVRYLVEEGVEVPAGAAIAEIEVMKMYMPLTVSDAGVIHLTKPPGSSIEAGAIVARLKLRDQSASKKIKESTEGFASCMPAVVVGEKLHQRVAEHRRIIENVIVDGYEFEASVNALGNADAATDGEKIKSLIHSFMQNILNSQLPYFIFEELLSNHSSRMPVDLETGLSEKLQQGLENPTTERLAECKSILEDYLSKCDFRDRASIASIIEGIKPHIKGPKVYAEETLAMILERFYSSAALFDGAATSDAVLLRLRDSHGANTEEYFRYFAAHKLGEARTAVITALIKQSASVLSGNGTSSNALLACLRKLTKLGDPYYCKIAQAAREALMNSQLPSLAELQQKMEAKLLSYKIAEHASFVAEMVTGSAYHMDVLPSFFLHSLGQVRQLALEIYIRRVFEAFNFLETFSSDSAFSWVVAAPSPAKLEITPSPALSSADFYERRAGAFAAFDSVEAAHRSFAQLVARFSPTTATKNLIYIAVPDCGQSDNEVLASWQSFLKDNTALLKQHEIRRITIILIRALSTSMGYYTFREALEWGEDCQVRHMEPAMAYLLELSKILCHHTIKLCHADPSGQVHIYKGEGADGTGRLFIRVLIRPMQMMRGHNTLASLAHDASGIFEEVLDAVAMVQSRQRKPLDCNHLYIYLLPTFYADPTAAADMFLREMAVYEEKLLKLRVMEGEIRMNLATARGETPQRYRFFLWNETGFVNRVAIYKEIRSSDREQPKLYSLDGKGELEGKSAVEAHPPLSKLQVKRNRAHALETSYVYDFPSIFRRAVELSWTGMNKPAPSDCCKAVEMMLEDGNLREITRPAGENDIGMVAWKVTIRTPQNPEARVVVVIANDIDFEIGSFGVAEDKLFTAASVLSRENRWPRIFLSANSGARIGLAEELRGIVKAKWVDACDPTKGFEYLYLDPEDYSRVRDSVRVEFVENGFGSGSGPDDAGSKGHYKITDILTGLGVENLSGSALIASETSRAYTETFTLTLVTGRSVGIGAYLVRLGQRVIQKQVQPIILTGVQALNNLLGRDVYASNLQIGGPQIMAANGVSHLVVRTDLDGIQAAVKWLDFIPKHSPSSQLKPILSLLPTDDPERPIAYRPAPSLPYDPRLLVRGAETGDGEHLGGLLDHGSFVEYLEAWARSVVVGRGRLGGLPVAVLLVETRTTESLIPADPASPSSESVRIAQAGQVWYPDSAYKTAQFIRDCNYGERLPLLILANWRGFSGGQRDLFDEILKFGSYIVDALREYRQPIFVYLPPQAQLRGGSWVVVDSAINPRQIEMYAEPSSRGGIMEAEGLVAIKFRGQQLQTLMHRLVPDSRNMPKPEQDRYMSGIHQIACHFADLHDRPGRMAELGIVRGIVAWRGARRFLYHRLRVRLWITQIVERAAHLCHVSEADQGAMHVLHDEIVSTLHGDWLPTFGVDGGTSQDAAIADALDRHHASVEAKVQDWCRNKVAQNVNFLLENFVAPGDRTALLQKLLAEDRARSVSPNR